MKKKSINIFRSIVKGMIFGKRRQAIAMETYLNCCESIQRLIDTRKLGINLKERHAVLDISLHMAFMPKGTSSRSINDSDKRYANFFDKLVAYMNVQLGRMQKPEIIDPKEDTITFHVTIERRRYVDNKGNPLPAHLQVEFDTVLVGAYRGGVIDYKSVNDNGQE